MVTIGQLAPDLWQQYKALRLEALQTDPQAFGGSYVEEVVFSEALWQERICNMWFAMIDGQPVGMVGLLPGPMLSTRHKAMIISMWVKPSFRGQGIAKALMQEIQRIAPAQGFIKLFLDVTTTQTAAVKLYTSVGFQKVGLQQKEVFINGQYLDQYLMEWLA
jgi:ribosomal protein S18 acetylase RimI-like enzyme